jgi:hypothetical protein
MVFSEARVFFEAGNARDGWFTYVELLAQTDRAIDIFESKTRGTATGLFLFDNAPSHQKRADDALSARYLPKRPNEGWTRVKDGPRMRDGWYEVKHADGVTSRTVQPLYFHENHPVHPGWFKGMEQIIRERGLWPQVCDARGRLVDGKLNAQCESFKCQPGKTDCCCRRLLFNQPDFAQQKSALTELVECRGHICDYYPKYHCELNFIEQYWGAAKLRYRNSPPTSSMDEMRANVRAALDFVPLQSIQRCVFSTTVAYSCADPHADMPTVLCALCRHIGQGSQEDRLHGQTAGITAIGLCLPKWLPKFALSTLSRCKHLS